jgi:predicted DNA-binding transcriptional regulator AlpA
VSTKPANDQTYDKNPPFELRIISTRPGLPRLVLWKKDVSQMLGVSLRTLGRMISSGQIPRPNRRLRGRPAWFSITIYEWAADDSLTPPSAPR